MENCLFVANLPQNLSNYELAISLYLLFSKYGKVVIVKASRDSANRPFGFVEYTDSMDGRLGAKKAIQENLNAEGIQLGGRRIRIEQAKSTCKLIIRSGSEKGDFIETVKKYQKAFDFSIWPGKYDGLDQCVTLKFESSTAAETFAGFIREQKPAWTVMDTTRQQSLTDGPSMIAESFQRHSGLFQLRIPDTGVLPVSHAALSKITALLSGVRYAVNAHIPLPNLAAHQILRMPIPQQLSPLGIINRRYEDLYIEKDGSTTQKLFTDPTDAKESIMKLNPHLGDADTDVFFGRLDNQEVTLDILHQRVLAYGRALFIRLCNRLVSRIDNVPVDSTAYVRFATSEAAQRCIESENGATWMGRIIKCEKCWNMSTRQTPPPLKY